MSRDAGDYIVRVSIGSLARLNIVDLRLDYPPSTLYLLQYSPTGCLGRCSFCSQSIVNRVSKKYLSRITWYPVKLSLLTIKLIEKQRFFDRICLQTILKDNFINEVIDIVNYMRDHGIENSFSIASTPVHPLFLEKLYSLNVDYFGIGLDATTPKLFRETGKPYSWETYMWFIREALKIFGERHVYIHLIIGLGENPGELYGLMKRLIDMGCDIALFPYTSFEKSFNPITGLSYYRSAQIIRYFLLKEYRLHEILNDKGFIREEFLRNIIEEIDKYYEIFLTTGCPGCNRPYYTENPRGPFYNLYSLEHFRKYREFLVRELKKLINHS